ncbi:MAG: hypothetical protein IJF73_04930 [Clostridia bacterium]|nr:hypothetical protein [Clostridia bacterium]
MSIQTKGKTPSKAKKWLIPAVALLLLAAIVFAIVWSNIDHSYRYDKKDLSAFFDASVLDKDTLAALDVRVDTTVTEDKILTRAQEKLIALETAKGASRPLYGKKTDAIFNDVVWLYYEVFKVDDATGANPTLVMSNTAITDPKASTVVRLGSGTLASALETLLIDYGSFTTNFSRKSDAGDVFTFGENLVLNVKATYENDGTTADYIKSKTYTYYYKAEAATAEENADNVTDYEAKLDLGVSDTTVNDKFVAALRQKLADTANCKVGTTLTFDLDGIVVKDGAAAQEVSFEVKITSAIKAEKKTMTTKLPEKLTYKGADDKSQELTKDSYITFNVMVESVASLNETTVKALLGDALTEELTPADKQTKDEKYAEYYLEYTKGVLIDEYLEDTKKNDLDDLKTVIRNALWKKIAKEYATTDKMLGYPESEITRYYKTALNNYEYEYNTNSTNLKTYKTLDEYILKSAFGKTSTEIAEWDEEKREAEIRALIEKDAKEQIARKLVLFSLADVLEVSVDRKDMKDAKETLYAATYTQYYNMYKQLLSGSYSATDLEAYSAAYAESYASAAVDGLTDAYLREYATMAKVLEALLPDPVAYAESHVTWTLSGEADTAE